ncbi:DNA-directed RNA polymerase III-like protein [Parathielavia appendiculata]|uniref:DNA-directed RNA polymerase III subunit RPC6 n=1 Tax=Parathielavia appendiculata TaxID=2587402 RepID=A0AAN6UAC5_9PEZI|nr:DNA-directed RNA polymerase III-like protein [Parathielavia appendiculata]
MASTKMADDSAKLQILKDALYEEIRQHGSETRLFTQRDLLDLNIIPNNDLLLLVRVVQGLTDDKLLVGTTNHHAGLAWRWRSREEAKKYTSLPNDETVMVYSIIDEAGADGIWNRTIKNKLNMHEAVVKNCIKFLESKGYIASMKNVEHPNKKMYIKATLRPSERATGGPWFTDGELDTAFISELEGIVFEYIKTRSAYRSSQVQPTAFSSGGTAKPPKKGAVTADSTTARGTKRSATDISTDDTSAPARGGSAKSRHVFLPMPAGYRHYPTVAEIAKFIHDTGITNNTTLGEADIQQLVDVLTYDGLIEPVRVGRRRGYRVTRAMKQDTVPFQKRAKEREAGIGLDQPLAPGPEPLSNGLTEAPCGRCPVFELCEEGGPVSPSNCVYFLQWLDVEDLPKAVAPNVALPP